MLCNFRKVVSTVSSPTFFNASNPRCRAQRGFPLPFGLSLVRIPTPHQQNLLMVGANPLDVHFVTAAAHALSNSGR